MLPTPNNRAYLLLVDPVDKNGCWVTQADYDFLANASDKQIVNACARINALCKRKFNHQIADQVFYRKSYNAVDYTDLLLENIPIKNVVDVYLQVIDSFEELSTDAIQIVPESGAVSFLAFPETVLSNIATLAREGEYNIWFRYDSGFRINSDVDNTYPAVPENVKYATALMVRYQQSLANNFEGVLEFKTQTYSQKNSNPDNNPLLMEINELLKEYITYHNA